MGGPSDKRGRDFSANLEVPKIDSVQHQPDMARKHAKQKSVPGKVCAKRICFALADDLLCHVLSMCSMPLPLLSSCAGSDDEQDSDYYLDSDDCKVQQPETRAQKERAKAGLPELQVDQLASSIAPKMLTLSQMIRNGKWQSTFAHSALGLRPLSTDLPCLA